MLRFTVTLEDREDPTAVLEWYIDAGIIAKSWSEQGYRARIGFTPVGKHHRIIETWCNGKRIGCQED